MRHLADGLLVSETAFWNELHCIATERQRNRIVSGYAVVVNGKEFRIVDDGITDFNLKDIETEREDTELKGRKLWGDMDE